MTRTRPLKLSAAPTRSSPISPRRARTPTLLDDAAAAAAWERVAHASLMLAAQAARLVELLAEDPQRRAA